MAQGVRSAVFALASAAVILAALSEPAYAQTDDDRAAARAVATDGAQAFEQGRYADAVDLFRRAEALIHAPPHLLYTARALDKLGHLVEAHETYLKITREELAADAPQAFVDARAAAIQEEAAIAKRIPTLQVNVEGAPVGEVSVTLDGAPMPAALIGLGRPIDPGMHRVEARAKGMSAEPVSLNVAESGSAVATLKLQPVVAAAPEPFAPPPPVEAESHPGGALRIGAFAALGVGVVGLGVGTAFVIKNHNDRGDADALCPNGVCPASRRDEVKSLDDKADSAATLAWVGYGIGAVGLGTGAVLLLLSRSHDDASAKAASVRVHPLVGARSIGLAGEF